MKYYLAIDIGASSGRHILCHIENNKLVLEEVHRFNNNVMTKDNHYCWDIEHIFEEVKRGIRQCRQLGKIPTTISIDTWAVDYVLLDQEDTLVGNAYAYRDNRVDKYIDTVTNQISFEEIYNVTGIQHQKFNTIFQLASEDAKCKNKAVSYLMIPGYLNYLLTGKKVNEYTNMTTTQLLDYKTNKVSDILLDACNTNKDIFNEIVMPGTAIGALKKELINELGVDATVVVCASHDTGSAYMAAIEEDSIIISSGTWSLLGIETLEPIVNAASRKANFTNEGGYNYRYRFLKNIMGLWIIQEVAREFKDKYSFSELVTLARKEPFTGIFDVNEERFLKPKNMVKEIIGYFEERNQQVPVSTGQIAYCVYNSLAHCYQEAIVQLEDITQREYNKINILGGGCQNELLNELIAKVCKKNVIAGPIEATALGNILAQLIQQGEIKDLQAGKRMIKESFVIKTYKGEEYECKRKV